MRSGEMSDMEAKRRAAGDPVRLRIYSCFYLRDRWTAKELGDHLGLKPNGLYYHLRIMEEAGFLQVVDTRATGRMAERVYGKGDAQEQTVSWDAKRPLDLAMNLGAIVESNRVEAEEVLYRRAGQLAAGEEPSFVTWGAPTITTTPDEIAEFHERLSDLVNEFRDRGAKVARDGDGGRAPDSVWLSFTYMLFEQQIPTVVRDEGAELGHVV